VLHADCFTRDAAGRQLRGADRPPPLQLKLRSDPEAAADPDEDDAQEDHFVGEALYHDMEHGPAFGCDLGIDLGVAGAHAHGGSFELGHAYSHIPGEQGIGYITGTPTGTF
jgi:hypothetical protein